MLKKIIKLIKSFFYKDALKNKDTYDVAIGNKIGNVEINTIAQQIKHTKYKPGDSYKLGDMLVTLHATKEDMLRAIAATDKRRADREVRLTEKAIELMLMSPEELLEAKFVGWKHGAKAMDGKISAIMGQLTPRNEIRDLWAKASKMGYEVPKDHIENLHKLKNEEIVNRFNELTKDARSYLESKEKELVK